jgi:hypothetical protein
MKSLLILTVVAVVAAAATGCNSWNRHPCDPCSTGMGGAGYGSPVMGGTYAAPPAGVVDGGYLPAPG